MLEPNLPTVEKMRFACWVIGMAALAAGCTRQSGESAAPQTVAAKPAAKQEPSPPSRTAPAESEANVFVGSKTCRDCHADFYKLWSTSWHGLAMQPYTPQFANARLTPQQGDVAIGKRRYRVEIGPAAGCVRETRPDGERKLPHRPRDGREERLLPPHAHGPRPPPGASPGL